MKAMGITQPKALEEERIRMCSRNRGRPAWPGSREQEGGTPADAGAADGQGLVAVTNLAL